MPFGFYPRLDRLDRADLSGLDCFDLKRLFAIATTFDDQFRNGLDRLIFVSLKRVDIDRAFIDFAVGLIDVLKLVFVRYIDRIVPYKMQNHLGHAARFTVL